MHGLTVKDIELVFVKYVKSIDKHLSYNGYTENAVKVLVVKVIH
jgi:hypothetical protein